MNRPIKVLCVDNTYTFGGAINALAYLLAALDRDRYEPLVLSAQPQKALDQHFPGVDARHWPMKLMWVHDRFDRRITALPGFRRGPLRRAWSKVRAITWLAGIEAPAALRLAWFIRRHHIGLVHLNNGVEGLVAPLLAARIAGVPVVAHSRGPQGTSGAARLYARSADHWIAVSGTMAANLREAGVEPDRITVVHDALDLAGFEEGPANSALREDLGIPETSPVFGVFGRIIPWKGIREFVEAAARVMEAEPAARALVVGDPSDGAEDYFRSVRERTRELGIEDRVLFTGFRQDVAELMRLCDVVVHTSIVPEPFGMTVIEGMATGTPVVAAASGGPTEIIDPGRTGDLVDPRDADALAGAILGLIRDPERAAAMGARGAARARDHYSARRYARDVERVFDGVVISS